MESAEEESRKLYCGSLAPDTDEELLHELFVQAGPLDKIILPKDNQGCCRGFAFIVFKHECSVPYAIELFRDTLLFGRLLQLRARRTNANNVNHQRSVSAPANFNNFPPSSEPPLDFDSLLALSKNMLMPGSKAEQQNQTFPLPPPPPLWVPGSDPSAHLNPQWNMNYPSGLAARSGEYSDQNMQHNADFSSGENITPISRNLSRSSLQGHWSARNDSSMLPSDNLRRSDYRSDGRGNSYRGRDNCDRNDSRRDEPYGRDRYDDRSESRYRERNDRYRNTDRRERDEYRSRSGDHRDRRGRY